MRAVAYRHLSSARPPALQRHATRDKQPYRPNLYSGGPGSKTLGPGALLAVLRRASRQASGRQPPHMHSRPSGLTLGSARAYFNIDNRIPGSWSLLSCLGTSTACHPRPSHAPTNVTTLLGMVLTYILDAHCTQSGADEACMSHGGVASMPLLAGTTGHLWLGCALPAHARGATGHGRKVSCGSARHS